MADDYGGAETTLNVNVQGEDAIRRLAAAFADLRQQGISAQQAVQAVSARAGSRANETQARNVLNRAEQQASGIGAAMANRFGSALNQNIRAPFDVLRSSASQAGRQLLNLAGPLGAVTGQASLSTIAMVGLVGAVTGLLVPIVSLVAGLRLLRSSFNWAQQAAEEQIRVAGRTRRFFPQAMGAGLEAAEEEMRTRMGVATALFGEGADAMQEQITRRMTPARLRRGLRGDRDIFRRWGITPEAQARYEQFTGSRVDLTEWLNLFIVQREKLEQQAASADPQAAARAKQSLAMLADDTVKIFGQNFSDMVGALDAQQVQRLKGNVQAAAQLGQVEGATRRMVDFRISLAGLKSTFWNITRGIGVDVAPTITNFLSQLNRKMLETDDSGRSLGSSLRDLASSLANKAWETLRQIMESITPERVNSWIETINSWSPAETVDKLLNVFDGIRAVGTAVAELVSSIQQLWEAIPQWLKTPLHAPSWAGGPKGASGMPFSPLTMAPPQEGEGAPGAAEGAAPGGPGAPGGGAGGADTGAGGAVGPVQTPDPNKPSLDWNTGNINLGNQINRFLPSWLGGTAQPGAQAAEAPSAPQAQAPGGPPTGAQQQAPAQIQLSPSVTPTTEQTTQSAPSVVGAASAAEPPPTDDKLVNEWRQAQGNLRQQLTQIQEGATGAPGAPSAVRGGGPAPGAPPAPQLGAAAQGPPSAPGGGPPATGAQLPPGAPGAVAPGITPTPTQAAPGAGTATPEAATAAGQMAPTPPAMTDTFNQLTQGPQAAAQAAMPAAGPPSREERGPPATGMPEVPDIGQLLAPQPRAGMQAIGEPAQGAGPSLGVGPPAPGAPSPQDQMARFPDIGNLLRPQAGMEQAATGMAEQTDAVNALKSTAAGRAMALMADVEQGPGGPQLRMRSDVADQQQQGGMPSAGQTSPTLQNFMENPAWRQQQNIDANMMMQTMPWGREAETAQQGDVLQQLRQQDQSEPGHPMRSEMRDLLGLSGRPEAGEGTTGFGGYDSQFGGGFGGDTDTLTAPAPERWGAEWGGGITTQDGANFGAAAAESLRTGLEGVSIGGPSATSFGVTPRSAPKPTGGDTPTEA